MARKLTKRNARQVFDRILRMDAADQRDILAAFNETLDGLAAQDFFGTECQTDPRGDGREDD